MNRKDFEAVARVLKTFRYDGRFPPPHVDWMAKEFSTAFEKADGCHGFDRAKFLKLCGVPA